MCVIELYFNRIRIHSAVKIILQLKLHLQLGIGKFSVKLGYYREVSKMNLRSSIQVDIAENPAQPPEILILQPACITPAVYFYSQLVFAFPQVRGKIIFRWSKSIFAVTDQFTVHPNIESGFHPLEADEYGLTSPAFRYCKRTCVRADRIVFGWCKRRLQIRFGFSPRITDIGILRVVIALELPM
ncbi:hypothetical protein D3C80_1440820 [compost metagenome]